MRPTLYDWRRAQLLLAAAMKIIQIDDALAHGFAGERFFPLPRTSAISFEIKPVNLATGPNLWLSC
jgi:hypothetical protein